VLNKKYWKLEYSITLFVIIGVILLIMPISIENTRQANFISKWNEKYNRLEYMFSVINTHITDDIIKSFKKAKNSEEREQLLIQLIKPYMRIQTDINVPKKYSIRYMNKAKVYKGQLYYFEEIYFTEDGVIVGIKDLPKDGESEPIFIIMYDINGILPPNIWGKDIFGINIYDDGHIEPFGQGKDMNDLKKDCSQSGTGISCSYYYKIGGSFKD